MAKYKFVGPDRSTGVKDGNRTIPEAIGNRHWDEFLVWESEGNVADPWRDAEEEAEAAKQEELHEVDVAFMTAEAEPVLVTIDDIIYSFKAGYESSQMIDSARTLADNLNENDVELWDFYDNPWIFSKSNANDIAIAVGLSFRTNYSTAKHAKKVINDSEV